MTIGGKAQNDNGGGRRRMTMGRRLGMTGRKNARNGYEEG